MGLLDPIPERYTPRKNRYSPKGNSDELEALNRPKVTEDFEDSTHADRKKKKDEDDYISFDLANGPMF